MTKGEWEIYEHPEGWCIFDASLGLPHYKAELCEVDTKEAADMILAALTAQGERDELRTKLATWQGRAFKAEAAQADAEALRVAVEALEYAKLRLSPASSINKASLIYAHICQALDRIKAPAQGGNNDG